MLEYAVGSVFAMTGDHLEGQEARLDALEAIEEAGHAPGRDVFCGGVDWAPEALAKVLGGTLTTSLGGHFMDAAWSLILLYDHHRGRDFQLPEARSKNVPATSQNVDDVLRLTDTSQWHRIDFSRFSRVENPSLQDYDFSPQAVLEQLLVPA